MISRWIFDWRVLIRLTCSVSWSLHQLICRVTGYFKVGLFIYVNSWCLFWLVLLSWWGWPKWEMMLINMGNAPVLMHLSLLFSCNIKHPAKKRKNKKKKKKKKCIWSSSMSFDSSSFGSWNNHPQFWKYNNCSPNLQLFMQGLITKLSFINYYFLNFISLYCKI